MPASISLHIRLADIEPEIWRQVTVPANYTLAGLHFVIQAVMGWEGEHLHLFVIDGDRYGEPEDAAGGRPITEEAIQIQRASRELSRPWRIPAGD